MEQNDGIGKFSLLKTVAYKSGFQETPFVNASGLANV